MKRIKTLLSVTSLLLLLPTSSYASVTINDAAGTVTIVKSDMITGCLDRDLEFCKDYAKRFAIRAAETKAKQMGYSGSIYDLPVASVQYQILNGNYGNGSGVHDVKAIVTSKLQLSKFRLPGSGPIRINDSTGYVTVIRTHNFLCDLGHESLAMCKARASSGAMVKGHDLASSLGFSGGGYSDAVTLRFNQSGSRFNIEAKYTMKIPLIHFLRN